MGCECGGGARSKTAYYLLLEKKALDGVFEDMYVVKESLVELTGGVMAACKVNC
jgi:hypothetical protein